MPCRVVWEESVVLLLPAQFQDPQRPEHHHLHQEWEVQPALTRQLCRNHQHQHYHHRHLQIEECSGQQPLEIIYTYQYHQHLHQQALTCQPCRNHQHQHYHHRHLQIEECSGQQPLEIIYTYQYHQHLLVECSSGQLEINYSNLPLQELLCIETLQHQCHFLVRGLH